MTQHTIRMAGPQDAAAVADMANALNLEHGKSPQAHTAAQVLADSIAPGGVYDAVVAEYRGTVVAYATILPFFNSDTAQPGLWLGDLYVKPGARGKSLGQALISRVARIARERNFQSVSWGVVADNAGALALYAKLGAVDADARILELDATAIARLARDDAPA